MSIKTFIFSQPDKPIVKEKKEIDQTYKKFRFEIIASVFISYAVFYLTRKNFSAAMPAMLTETSLTAEDFAIMSSIFYILYGAMKFVGGMLVDKINPKAMTGPVLIGVGIVNILFGFSDSVAAVYVLYSLNAILQGTSFPPMAKIMASWFSKNERGRWWAIVELRVSAVHMHRAGAASSGYLLHPHRDSVHHHGLRLIRTAYAFCRRLSGCDP